MLPEKPETSRSEADNVERHTGQQNTVCDGAVHQMAIVGRNWAAFRTHKLFTTQQDK